MSCFTNLTTTVNTLEDISDTDEDDSQGGEDDSEGDDDDSKGEELGNITTMLSSLVTNCPWTVNFSPPPAQEF